MYTNILVPLDNSPSDQAIIKHIPRLAKLTGAHLVLVHVADGFAARLQDQLNLEDSEEINDDRDYLEKCRKIFAEQGLEVKTYLVLGEPADQILNIAEQERCDLIAMATHGHKMLKDFILGSVADTIRHRTSTPILMIKGT